jgi:hypothetical protein
MPSYETISAETGRDVRTVKRILERAGVNKTDPNAIETVRGGLDARMHPTSPSARKMAAEAEMKERQNLIAKKLEEESYVEIAQVEATFRIIINKLEIIPQKLASEFNLEPKIVARLTALLDECRQEVSKEIVKKPQLELTASIVSGVPSEANRHE